MLKSVLLLVVAMVSIQSGATLAKSLFPVLGAAGTSAVRLFFATIILWAIWRPWKYNFTRLQLQRLALYGLSLGLMNLLFYFAIVRIPLGVAVALEFTGPLAVAIAKSKSKFDYFWAVLAGIGIYLLLPVSGTSNLDPIGMALALGAGFFWALYILYGQSAGSDLHGGLATTIGMTFAALIVIPFGIYQAGWSLLDLGLLPLGILVAVFSSALPYSLEMVSMKRLSTQTFGVLMSLEPAIGAMAGLAFLNEELLLVQWLAIFCIIFSSLGSTLTSARR
ncbi:MAG TPA: EamA family transporter [Bacteriovoracaceae bacterium]|nr:EamA family transporter [Bacteriovoracaceae bacterium]